MRLSPTDSASVTWLRANGVRVERPRVRLHTPPDLFGKRHRAALADSIDRGIAALERLIGDHDWRRHRDRPVHVYLVPEPIISHGSGMGAVFISAYHAERGFAPYLHESAHELLHPLPPYLPQEYADSAVRARLREGFPLWLFEGLAEYLARRAAREEGLVEGDILEIGGLEGASTTCAGALATRPELAGFMGGRGYPPELNGPERARVATGFYACALSFTAFLAERVGLNAVVELVPASDPNARVAELAAVSPDTLRAEWLATLPDPPAIAADVFLPQVVSTDSGEAWLTMDPEQRVIVYGTHDEGWTGHALRYGVRGPGRRPLGPVPFAGEFQDRGARFAPDGARLLFSSNRPLPGAPADATGDWNLWWVAWEGAWGEPEPLPAPVSTDSDEYHGSATSSGILYFASRRPGGMGRSDLYRARPEGAAWRLERLPAPINSEHSEADVYVDPAERYIIFARTDDPSGFGGDDLYLAERRGEGWSAPRNLGPLVNTEAYEYGAWVAPDGTLFFTSHRDGQADIYTIPGAAVGLPVHGAR